MGGTSSQPIGMDIFDFVFGLLNPGKKPAPMGMNQPDLDPIDRATGQLTPGGVPAVPKVPVVTPAAPPNGGTVGPLNAQEAYQAGDPKLIQFMKQRPIGGAKPIAPTVPTVPIVPAPSGYGAKPRQNSFGDGTGG